MSFTAGAGTRFLLSTDSSGTISPSGPLSIAGGTATANTPVLSATQTWNNAAATFTGWQLNVTDTASNAASLLLDLQVGGTSQFSVRKNGQIQTIAGTGAAGNLAILFGSRDVGFSAPVANTLRIGRPNSADVYINVSTNPFIRLSGGGYFGWAATGADGLQDLALFRDAANTLAQRNGVNAQTFRVYNTFTDASNYERGFARWNSNVFEIGAESAGTGTARTVQVRSNSGVLQLYDGNSVWSITSGAMNIGSRTMSGAINVEQSGYTQMSEMTAPAAPATNSVRIYAEDNGSGKTRLMALFATGAAQQIAIEP